MMKLALNTDLCIELMQVYKIWWDIFFICSKFKIKIKKMQQLGFAGSHDVKKKKPQSVIGHILDQLFHIMITLLDIML